MEEFDKSQIAWSNEWIPFTPEDARSTEIILRRELNAGHPLFVRGVEALAYWDHNNDFLFYLGEEVPQFAVVHLTFVVNHGPELPKTVFFDTLEHWVQQCLVRAKSPWEQVPAAEFLAFEMKQGKSPINWNEVALKTENLNWRGNSEDFDELYNFVINEITAHVVPQGELQEIATTEELRHRVREAAERYDATRFGTLGWYTYTRLKVVVSSWRRHRQRANQRPPNAVDC